MSERTDCYFDNLQIGLSMWDKLLLLAREVETWTNNKMRTLAQPHPFQTEQDVLAMQVTFSDMMSDEQIEYEYVFFLWPVNICGFINDPTGGAEDTGG